MKILLLIFLSIYNITCLFYFKRHFPAKRKHWLFYAIAITINLTFCYIMGMINYHQIRVLIMMVSFMLELNLLFEMNFLRLLHGGGSYILVIYSSRGIIVSVFSIILKKSINEILSQDFYYNLIGSISALIAIGFIWMVRKMIVPDEKLVPLFPHTNQLQIIVFYQSAIIIYILLLSNGLFYDINALWFSILYLVSFLIIMALLIFVWNASMKVSALLEYELHTKRLQEQLDRQVRHYKSYKKFTESFRTFKHDYKSMMSTVNCLIKNNENDKALSLLSEIEDTMQKKVQIHKNYSNNVLLDAILMDAADTCEEYHIKFSAMLHLPDNLMLSDLDIVRISTNMLDNAVEACTKVSNKLERFIEVKGSSDSDWSFIEIVNSFSGEIRYQNNELVTTKKDKNHHGFGIKNIKNIVESSGGIVLIDVNQEKRIFTLRLLIPRAR